MQHDVRAFLVCALLASSLGAPCARAQGGVARNRAFAAYARIDTSVVALTHARIIDGTGAAPTTDQTILIRDGKIASIGPSARTQVPTGVQTIDLTGKSVIPGLVMVHEHLYYPNTAGWYGVYDESFSRLYLAGGVTAMRTAGNLNGYSDLALKQQIDQGRKPGPWIDVTAPYLQGKGGVAGQFHVLKDADEARRMVNYWADVGSTSFKAFMDITHDELQAAVEEVHKRGLKITGHLCAVTYRDAAEMGIDNREHGFFVATDFVRNKTADVCADQGAQQQSIVDLDTASAPFKELVQLFIRKHVALTSTLTVFETLTPGRPMPKGLDLLTPVLRDAFEGFYRAMQSAPVMNPKLYAKASAMEVAFVRAGGTLLAGTDPTAAGGVIPGFANQRALELLVEAGFTPLEAIRIATLNGANFLGIAARSGSIAVGKQADLVVLGGDPSVNISDIRNMEIVFRNGIGFDPTKLIESVRGKVGIF